MVGQQMLNFIFDSSNIKVCPREAKIGAGHNFQKFMLMKNISGSDWYICEWLVWQINTIFSIITTTLVVVSTYMYHKLNF